MKKIYVNGLNRECSQIVLGSMMFSPTNMEFVTGLLNTYVEAGGNTIDLAHVYNNGESEKAVGLWLKETNLRDEIVILDKGAHPDANGPRVTPEAIEQDLQVSLQRLQVEHIDIYMLHRDDPTIPVEVIINALNKHIQAGLVQAIGVSNWTTSRIQEANEYAEKNNLIGFAVNSPNLCLAKANEPRWPGCVSVDEKDKKWHTENQLPLFAWSSQAGGFFTGRFTPENLENKEMVRVYYNEVNWERYRRAEKLAWKKGVTTNQIALAYVLNQPFPTCALIGPSNIEELQSSIVASNVTLTAEEMKELEYD
jgi:aryl-alcohol dehydrogenase-like predicted oxidoreductase